MIHLPGVFAAAGEVQRFCQSQGWRFCFIGGVALQRWGEPRLTQDVDLTLLTGFGQEEQFVDVLLKEFIPRRSDAREFALSRRVLLIETRIGGSSTASRIRRPSTSHGSWRCSIPMIVRRSGSE